MEVMTGHDWVNWWRGSVDCVKVQPKMKRGKRKKAGLDETIMAGRS